jgi:hypothetical protein
MKIQTRLGKTRYGDFFYFFDSTDMFNTCNGGLYTSLSSKRLKNKKLRRRLEKYWRIVS